MSEWPGPDWRQAADYARLRGLDRAGLMWEWLRRDPGYVAWYARASTTTRGTGGGGRAAGEDPAQWGIHFRRAPGGGSPGGPDHLACRARSRYARGDGHAQRRR